MCDPKFFTCKNCGKFLYLNQNHCEKSACCGEDMQELAPNTVEASKEKHVPDVKCIDGLVHVKIGSAPHPMIEEHHIEFIYLQTEHGGQLKYTKVGEDAEAVFSLSNDTPVAVYEYCNLHGLWKAEICKECCSK